MKEYIAPRKKEVDASKIFLKRRDEFFHNMVGERKISRKRSRWKVQTNEVNVCKMLSDEGEGGGDYEYSKWSSCDEQQNVLIDGGWWEN